MNTHGKGRRTLVAALIAGLAAMAQPALAAEGAADEPYVEVMAGACLFCHGTDGNGIGAAIPSITGLPADQFIYMMETYRDGYNPSTVMGRIARGYDDDQIAALAEYFGAKPFARPAQPWIDAGVIDEGAELADEYCSSCHENEGRDGEGVGILAGQKLLYMQFSVDDFLSGAREMERRQARKFRELMDDHGREGFDKILNYYASVK